MSEQQMTVEYAIQYRQMLNENWHYIRPKKRARVPWSDDYDEVLATYRRLQKHPSACPIMGEYRIVRRHVTEWEAVTVDE